MTNRASSLITAPQIYELLSRTRFRFDSESQLQDRVASCLEAWGADFEREASLTKSDRTDFLVGDVGVEVKVDAAKTAVIRQLHRYAQSQRIAALILLTNRSRHLSIPRVMNDKPVHVVFTEQSL